jgi:hypothetical protein
MQRTISPALWEGGPIDGPVFASDADWPRGRAAVQLLTNIWSGTGGKGGTAERKQAVRGGAGRWDWAGSTRRWTQSAPHSSSSSVAGLCLRASGGGRSVDAMTGFRRPGLSRRPCTETDFISRVSRQSNRRLVRRKLISPRVIRLYRTCQAVLQCAVIQNALDRSLLPASIDQNSNRLSFSALTQLRPPVRPDRRAVANTRLGAVGTRQAVQFEWATGRRGLRKHRRTAHMCEDATRRCPGIRGPELRFRCTVSPRLTSKGTEAVRVSDSSGPHGRDWADFRERDRLKRSRTRSSP